MQDYDILDRIGGPEDLKTLTGPQLRQLCGELRQFMIDTVSENGGHFASNLGVVELTVALHRVFESPVDRIVWDVGHQSYIHKILTGRKQEFITLRQEGGLCGFPKTKESEHDAFVAGHSATSIAVADGLACAKRLRGEPGHAVAVIGDGAFTGGMAYEGLNNAARGYGHKLIVILNDNEMSISRNHSNVAAYLSRLRTNRPYFQLKDFTRSVLGSIPVVGDNVVEAVAASKSKIKDIVYQTSFFEELGFTYMGPVDGHDLHVLCSALERAKLLAQPVFLHVRTIKGRGYAPAESNPGAYHGVGKFDPRFGNGELQPGDNFSDEFGRYLTALATRDERICAVTAAMKYATGLHHFSRRFKQQGRFFDVGIAEPYAVTFSAALAAGGQLPVCAVYSTFLQRGYDQILHDCSIEPRHMVLAVDRAGLVGEDGETHQGLYDCAYLSTIPGMTIYSPATYAELRACTKRALYHETGVVAVRYPRGAQPKLDRPYTGGGNFLHLPGKKVLLVTYGREWAEAVEAARLLRGHDVEPGLLKLTRVFPIDRVALACVHGYDMVVFLEEGVRTGGIGEHFFAALAEGGYQGRMILRAVERFVAHAPVKRQIQSLGLDGCSVCDLVQTKLAEEVAVE